MPLSFYPKYLKYEKKLKKRLFSPNFTVSCNGNQARIAIFGKGTKLYLRAILGGPSVSYDSKKAKHDLGGTLSKEHESELLMYYPDKYSQKKRQSIIKGVMIDSSHAAMLEQWIKDKDQTHFLANEKGGPGKAVPVKIKRLVIRLLYIQLRKQGLSQQEANDELSAKFDLLASSIAKVTTSKVIDQKFGK